VLSHGSRWFLAFGVLGLAGLALGMWYLDAALFDDGVEPGQPVEYTVERGAAVGTVADDLADLGVVSSGFRFRTAAEEAELPEQLQPGVFQLETGMSNEEAVEVLAAGPESPPIVRFTVEEGLDVDRVLDRLAEQFDAYEVADFQQVLDERTDAGRQAADEEDDGTALQAALTLPDWVPEPADSPPDTEPYEGVFWPDTYEISDEAEPQEVLQRLVDQLEDEFEALPEQLIGDLDAEGRYRLLVLGSLVERETRVDAERDTVAGVITNRLEEGMQLQIDATVVYALGGGPTEQVTFDDLEVENPYNTYRIEGLPPTPISNMGTAALEAAAEPADVDYRFYVLDPACDGSHRFAVSDDEHQANVEQFRQADRCIGEELDGDEIDPIGDDE
jgi:UPF0755 protein